MKTEAAGRRRGGSLGLDLAGLLILSLVLGAVANHVRPQPLPWTEVWSRRVETQALELGLRVADVEATHRWVEDGRNVLFDARAPEAFGEGHLPLALNLPSEQFEDFFMQYAGMLIPEDPILVYCSGVICDESLQVCRYLLEQGFTNLVLFAGGYEVWEAAGHPVEAGW